MSRQRETLRLLKESREKKKNSVKESFLGALRESKKYSSEEVAELLQGFNDDLDPDSEQFNDWEDVELQPWWGRDFEERDVRIIDLFKSDPDFENYVKLAEPRYEEDEMPEDSLYDNPIIVVDGEVVDGWSRSQGLFNRGEDSVRALVALPGESKKSTESRRREVFAPGKQVEAEINQLLKDLNVSDSVELRWVQLEEIRVDYEPKRGIDTLVSKIRESEKVLPLLVADMIVQEGEHRYQALKRLGVRKVPILEIQTGALFDDEDALLEVVDMYNLSSDFLKIKIGQKITESSQNLDAEYLAAVEAGDLEKCQRLVDAAAKKAGYAIGPVYHGTVSEFNSFDNKKTGRNDRGLWGLGHYFANSLERAKSYADRQADGARVIAAFISLKNPLVLKTGNDLVIRLPDGTNTRDLVGPNLDGSKIKTIAIEGGHDGVVQLKPNGEIGDLVVYSPNQIKSADPVTYDESGNVIPLSKRFNSQSKKITESYQIPGKGEVLSPEKSRQLVQSIRAGDSSSRHLGKISFEPETGSLVRKEIPISEIRKSYLEYLRDSTDPERVERYAKERVEAPVYLRVNSKGNLVVGDGGHRLLAAIDRGDSSIDVLLPVGYVREGDRYVVSTKKESYQIPETKRELEFVCVNSESEAATPLEKQDELFDRLKEVPGVIVYVQDFSEGGETQKSMAVIVKDGREKTFQKIRKIAANVGVELDLENEVEEGFIDDIVTNRLEALDKWYDTDVKPGMKEDSKRKPLCEVKWYNVDKPDMKKEIMRMVRLLKKMYRSAGYSCSNLSRSPYSDSVYFRVEGLGRYGTEIRVSDHAFPGQGTFRGWDINLDNDQESLQEILEEMQEEIDDDVEEMAKYKKINESAEGKKLDEEIGSQEIEVEPTEKQKKSGNYRKGKIKIHGLNISIENPKGSFRSGKAKDGKEWSQKLKHHYGYIKGTVGRDKDHVDVFIGNDPESEKVFVINQLDRDGKFDEHKCMVGFKNEEAARKGYLANYEKGWQGLGSVVEKSVDEFKEWLKNGNTRRELKESNTGWKGEVLYHSSEDVFDDGKPDFDAYFGTQDWKDVFRKEFGDNEYEIVLLDSERENILDLESGSKDAVLIRTLWGGDVEDGDGFYYEDWVDKEKILPEVKKLGYEGVKFQEEYILSEELIKRLPVKESKQGLKEIGIEGIGQKITESSQNLDAEYLAAVEAGDTKKCQRMVDAVAKRAGYEIGPVYHGGSNAENINRFDPVRSASGVLWFTSSRDYAEFTSYDKFEERGGKVYNVFVRTKNPFDVRGKQRQWDWVRSDKKRVDSLKSKGYDAIILDDENGDIEGTSYAVFSPSQIKLADPVTYDDNGDVIPLSKRFDSRSKDIRESVSKGKVVVMEGAEYKKVIEAGEKAVKAIADKMEDVSNWRNFGWDRFEFDTPEGAYVLKRDSEEFEAWSAFAPDSSEIKVTSFGIPAQVDALDAAVEHFWNNFVYSTSFKESVFKEVLGMENRLVCVSPGSVLVKTRKKLGDDKTPFEVIEKAVKVEEGSFVLVKKEEEKSVRGPLVSVRKGTSAERLGRAAVRAALGQADQDNEVEKEVVVEKAYILRRGTKNKASAISKRRDGEKASWKNYDEANQKELLKMMEEKYGSPLPDEVKKNIGFMKKKEIREKAIWEWKEEEENEPRGDEQNDS